MIHENKSVAMREEWKMSSLSKSVLEGEPCKKKHLSYINGLTNVEKKTSIHERIFTKKCLHKLSQNRVEKPVLNKDEANCSRDLNSAYQTADFLNSVIQGTGLIWSSCFGKTMASFFINIIAACSRYWSRIRYRTVMTHVKPSRPAVHKKISSTYYVPYVVYLCNL